MTTIRASIVCLFVLITGHAAAAPDADRSVGAMYDSGVALFRLGRYEDSIRSFEYAYRLNDNTRLLYNIAVARMRLGELQLRLDNPDARLQFVLASDVLHHALDRQRPNSRLRFKIQDMIASADTRAESLRRNETSDSTIVEESITPKPKLQPPTVPLMPALPPSGPDPDERERRENRFRLIWGLVTAAGAAVLAAGFGMVAGAEGMQADIRVLRDNGETDAAVEKAGGKGKLTGAGAGLVVLGSVTAALGVTLLSIPTKTRVRLFIMLGGLGGSF